MTARRCVCAALPVLSLALSASCAWAQPYSVPQDGLFWVERTRAFTFKATLAEDWMTPHVGAGTLRVFAPVAPELPGQAEVSTRLFLSGNAALKAGRTDEVSGGARPLLGLEIPSTALTPGSGTPLRVEYEGTLFSRSLRRGKPTPDVPDLTREDRRRYLTTSTTMDHGHPAFLGWMNDRGLRRRQGEQVMQFGHRVFTDFVENATYGGDTSSYEARRPSRVCSSLASDCGGLALLFVAVMRANDVPARTLFGRWVVPQAGLDGQYHVLAEFFVPKSGWVPLDIGGTIEHAPRDRNSWFGSTDGRFLTFHVDSDLEPTEGLRHAWAQYLLLQWEGRGDFWKEARSRRTWDVERVRLRTEP